MIDLTEIVASGHFQSGFLVGEHNLRDISDLPWNGSTDDTRGFIRMGNFKFEDGNTYHAIQMHPKSGSNGTIKAWLPWRQLPPNAFFKAKVGFLNGAANTNGVTFQVWEHHNHNGREVWNRIINLEKDYTMRLLEIDADLSHLSGQNVGIELRVDAGSSSGQDWAAWIDPAIDSREENGHGAVWTINPVKLTIIERNETRPIEGRGDEPYIGGMYFRSIFGKLGSTKVLKIDDLVTLGENVKHSVDIPESANLAVFDSASTWNDLIAGVNNGVQVMGYAFIAMEEDVRGKSIVKEEIEKFAGRLFNSLKEHVEGDISGLLNAEEVLEKVERDVYTEPGGLSGGASAVKGEGFKNLIEWLFRGDDIIGQNMLVLVNLSEEILRSRIEEYDPSSRTKPVSALTDRTFELDLKGEDEGFYRLTVKVERSNEGTLVR